MSSFVLDAQCEIWRSQWPDKIILTTFASKELLESNKRTKSLDKELTEDKVKKATQIFVPVNVEEVHWILVVMDFKDKEVQILDSFQSNTYLVPAYQVATNLEMYLMTKFGMITGVSKDRNLKLAKQTNGYDCGLHVLLYIQRYGRSDMYGIDTEQILRYRKQLAYELKHESNDHPSTSTQYIDESLLHVYSARPPSGSSRSPLHDLSSTKIPSVSGSSSSTSSDSLGGSQPNAGKEDTLSSSLGLNAEQEDAEVHSKSKRERTKTDKTKVKTPVVPQRLHTEAAHLLCDLVLKADPNNESSNLITLNSLVMTIKECATFLSGGSATLEMLKETFTLTVGLDTKENNRYRVIVGPMDMSTLDNDTGSKAFKDAVKTQMVVPSIPQTCMMVFLPVKKGSDWSVYCINKVCQRIDYLICSSNEEPMDAAELCKPLLKEVDFSFRKIFDFMDWSPAPVPFEKKISSSDTGLLAMYFMEMYNGKQFRLEVEDTKTWSESYRKSVLEQLFSQRANTPTSKKKLLHPKA